MIGPANIVRTQTSNQSIPSKPVNRTVVPDASVLVETIAVPSSVINSTANKNTSTAKPHTVPSTSRNTPPMTQMFPSSFNMGGGARASSTVTSTQTSGSSLKPIVPPNTATVTITKVQPKDVSKPGLSIKELLDRASLSKPPTQNGLLGMVNAGADMPKNGNKGPDIQRNCMISVRKDLGQHEIIDLTSADLPTGTATAAKSVKQSPAQAIGKMAEPEQRGPGKIRRSQSVAVRTHPNIQNTLYPFPGPLPPSDNQSNKLLPQPFIQVEQSTLSIFLSWDLPTTDRYSKIAHYEIYVSKQEIGLPSTPWSYLATVKAIQLPMRTTLQDIETGVKYSFAVRAVDENKRYGPFSNARSCIKE